MTFMLTHAHRRSLDRGSWRSAGGYTLIEILVAVVLLALVVLGLSTALLTTTRSKDSNQNMRETTQAARTACDFIARDLRMSGYGADVSYVSGGVPSPQVPISYIDSLQVLLCANLEPYPDTSATLRYPLAYNPASTGKPFPFVGTPWTPVTRYRTNAETVRWTLDLDNDGALSTLDFSNAEAIDAVRTRNPNDWVLVRQVYGDSSGGIPGTNGPTTERIALVSRPGGGVAPIFTVYMKNATDPWNWSFGPVPQDSLGRIERIKVTITAPSPKPNFLGKYASTVFTTEVFSRRNLTDLGP